MREGHIRLHLSAVNDEEVFYVKSPAQNAKNSQKQHIILGKAAVAMKITIANSWWMFLKSSVYTQTKLIQLKNYHTNGRGATSDHWQL